MSELTSIVWLGLVAPPLRAVTTASLRVARRASSLLGRGTDRLASRLEDGPLASEPPQLKIDIRAAALRRPNRTDDDVDLRRHARPIARPPAEPRRDAAQG